MTRHVSMATMPPQSTPMNARAPYSISSAGTRSLEHAPQARGRVEAPPSIATTVPLIYEARAETR